VRFDRPYFVGEQYRLSGPYLVVDSLSVTRGRDTQRSEHRRLIHLDLGVKVLELGPRGNSRRASVTVHLLTQEAGGETTALVAPGPKRLRFVLVEPDGLPDAALCDAGPSPGSALSLLEQLRRGHHDRSQASRC
jgi:hypothetical protein